MKTVTITLRDLENAFIEVGYGHTECMQIAAALGLSAPAKKKVKLYAHIVNGEAKWLDHEPIIWEYKSKDGPPRVLRVPELDKEVEVEGLTNA